MSDPTVKHVIKEGSRHHVIWWTGGIGVRGARHCSEPNCEVNQEKAAPSSKKGRESVG